jgi:hypothetical protein
MMQRKLVDWLNNRIESQAADWYEKYWTVGRGNWAKAYSGVGGTNNHNSTEVRWGVLKKFVCGKGNCGSTAGRHKLCINIA